MTPQSAESSANPQYWADIEFCTRYSAMWEISIEKVHYGWLAPGENELRLFSRWFKESGAKQT
jgi:hypothetical protein